MSARTSQYIRLARLTARRNIEANPDMVRTRVYAAIEVKQTLEKRFKVYQCNKEAHKLHGNHRNALRSRGCGCVLCSTRHVYARLKYERKQFQRSYESDCSREIFLKLYKENSKEESTRDYFSGQMRDYTKRINEFKAQIKAIIESYDYFEVKEHN